MTLSWRVQKTWLEDGGHKSYIFTINFWEWGKSQQVQYIVERKQQTSFRIGKNIVLKKFIDLDLFKWPHFHWIYSRKICQKIDPWIRVNFRGSTFEKAPPPGLRLVSTLNFKCFTKLQVLLKFDSFFFQFVFKNTYTK